MRIALLSYDYPPETDGDSELGSHAFMHAKGLAGLGHEVHVFAGSKESGWRCVRDGSVTVTRYHHPGVLQRLGKRGNQCGLDQVGERIAMSADTVHALRRALRDGQFDVIETYAVSGEAALLAPLADLPLVVRVQDLLGLRPWQRASTMDRQLARCLQQLSIDAALAISTSSTWVLDRLRERRDLLCPAVVIPNGIDTEIIHDVSPVDLCETHGVPRKGVRIYCPSMPRSRAYQQTLTDVLSQVLSEYPKVHLVLPQSRDETSDWRALLIAVEAKQLRSRVHIIEDADALLRRSTIRGCEIFIRFADQGEGVNFDLLEAMACGATMLVGRANGIAELLRPEIDAIICGQEDVEPGRQALQRLVENPDLRARLASSALERCRNSFDLVSVAKQSEAFYHYALQRRVPTQIKRSSGPTLPLGPENWFHAWWLERSTRTSPSMALDAQGKPLFARLPIDALRFVEMVLNRSWCQGPAEWQVPEWGFLKELNSLVLELALDRRHHVGEDSSGAEVRLGLPPQAHPLFASDQAAIFLDEFWRLERVQGVEGWLHREVTRAGFSEAAVQRMALRRMAVEALHRCPSKESYAVGREIYRRPGVHAVVIAEDQEFFRSGPAGERFRERVENLGLHAPLHRLLYLQGDREGDSGRGHDKKARATEAAALVTVLIPSYQHEAFIEDAILSVLSQTRDDLQVLVVDDCSQDHTVELAQAIDDPRLEVRTNETNLGLGRSVQLAVESIETPYVALLNSDDLFHPDRLRCCLEVLQAHRKIHLVATGLEFIDRDGRKLTTADSCVIEVGPQTHGWLKWYELVRGQFDDAEDWVSLKNLIRHNILATSSNMVFRTSYLKKQMPAASHLKYCLDWQLFMMAAVEERLHYLPDPLLAYRFHDDNTVWFQDGGRGGYIIEVNRVIGTVLRTLLMRRKRKQAPREVVAELSELLQSDVIQHGETDGMTMFLVEIARSLDKSLACLDPTDVTIDALASGAILRNTLSQVSDRIDMDPWELVGLSQEAERFRIETHVAEEFLERARQLESEIGRLRHELAGVYGKVKATEQTEEAFEQERINMRRELVRVRAEMFSLFRRKDELEMERVDLSESHEQLAQSRDELQQQKETLAKAGRSLEDELTSLQEVLDETHRRGVSLREELDLATVTRDQTATALKVAESDLQTAESNLKTTESNLQTTESDLKTTESDLKTTKLDLQTAESDLETMYGRFRSARIENHAASEESIFSLRARFSRLVLDKLHLFGLWKTSLRLSYMIREPGWRAISHVGRILSETGRRRKRVLLACSQRFPNAATIPEIIEGRALLEAGFDLRIISFGVGRSGVLDGGYEALTSRRVALNDDGWLSWQDKKYFERRRNENVRHLCGLPGVDALLPRVFRFVRAAKTLGGGVVLAHAIDETALYALACMELCDIPYALVIDAEKGLESAFDAAVVAEIFAKAACIVTESHAIGKQWAHKVVKRMPYAFEPSQATAPARDMRILCQGVFVGQDLVGIAAAVKLLRDQGVDAKVDLLGEPQPAHGPLRVWDELQAGLDRLGIRESFTLHGSASPKRLAALCEHATVLVDVHSKDGTRGMHRSISAAMAASVPVITCHSATFEGVGSGAALLIEPGKPQVLVDALLLVHRDHDKRASLVAAGRDLYDSRLNPEAANREWFHALRKLCGTSAKTHGAQG